MGTRTHPQPGSKSIPKQDNAITRQDCGSRTSYASLVRDSFDLSFWAFAALALIMAAVCYGVLGPERFADVVASDRELLSSMLPRLAAAQLVAGLVWVMVPRDRLTQLLGRSQGRRGLIVATISGIVTPGGPASAFPLLAIMAAAGADRGILVAYITSWALLGVQRMVVWDVPFMGAGFSALRFLVCLPLPLLAGLIARRYHSHPAQGARP